MTMMKALLTPLDLILVLLFVIIISNPVIYFYFYTIIRLHVYLFWNYFVFSCHIYAIRIIIVFHFVSTFQ